MIIFVQFSFQVSSKQRFAFSVEIFAWRQRQRAPPAARSQVVGPLPQRAQQQFVQT